MKLYNFSHPLSQEAKEVLTRRHGITEFVQVPFHLDTTRPIVPQVRAIVNRAVGQGNNSPIAVILPGYAPAAAIVAALSPKATFIRLAAEPGSTPPKWMPAEAFVLPRPGFWDCIRDALHR